MFSIIDRLLFKETTKTLLVIVLVIGVVFVSNAVVRLLGKIVGGAFGSDVLLILVSLEFLKVMGFLIPPAFFFACLWVLGRMHQDSEVTALANAGVGDWRLCRALLVPAVPLAVLALWLAMWVMPWAKTQSLDIRYQQQRDPSIGLLKGGRFHEFEHGELTFFAEGASDDGAELQGVFVQHGGAARPTLVVAASARILLADDARMVVLQQGRRYEGVPGEVDYQISEFDEFGFRIPSLEAERSSSQTAQSSTRLWHSGEIADRAELQRRLVIPLSVFAFALLAIPLSRTAPRRGIYGRIGLAVLCYFIFMNLSRVAERWMVDGVTPAWLGIWWLPLATGLVATVLMALGSHRLARHARARLPRWMVSG